MPLAVAKLSSNMLVAKPTLIVTLTSGRDNTYKPGDLRRRVEARLVTTKIPVGLIQKFGIVEWCEDAAADFKGAFLTMRQESRGFHPLRAGAALPNPSQKLEFRVIIVCDRLGATQAGALGGFLDDIANKVLTAAEADISLELGVLLLDNYAPPAVHKFTVRARATSKTATGTIVDFSQVREACQHLLVLLLSAPDSWNQFADMADQNKWCTFGAAAAIMDQTEMIAYVRASTFARATEYLVQDPDPDTSTRILEQVSHLADRTSWTSAAEKILAEHDCIRIKNSADPSPPFQLQVSVPDQLAQLEKLDFATDQRVSKERRDHWGNVSTAAHGLLSMRRPSTNPLITGPSGLPNGLQRMRFMLQRLQSIMVAPPLIPTSDSAADSNRFRFSGPEMLGALANATATATNASRLRQKRVERSVLHPLGQLLWLVPFWLGFTLLLDTPVMRILFQPLTEGMPHALLAASITAVLGILEWWYWHNTLTRSQFQIDNDIMLTAGRQALYLTNSAIWRAHDATVAALVKVTMSVDSLHKLFDAASITQTAKIHNATISFPNSPRTYHLRDLAKCDRCVSAAIDALERAPESSISQTLADGLFPIANRPAGQSSLLAVPWHYERAFREARKQIEEAADQSINSYCPDIVLVVSGHPQMNNGAIWEWLISGSVPLGIAAVGGRPRYFFSDPAPALWETAHGGTVMLHNLNIGDQHYSRISSPLDCEIVCVCAYVAGS